MFRWVIRLADRCRRAKQFMVLLITFFDQEVHFRLGDASAPSADDGLFPHTSEAQRQLASLRTLWDRQIRAYVDSWYRIFNDAMKALGRLRGQLSDRIEEAERLVQEEVTAAEQRSEQEQKLAEQQNEHAVLLRQMHGLQRAAGRWFVVGSLFCLSEIGATLSLLREMFEPGAFTEWIQVSAIAVATAVGLVWSAAQTFNCLQEKRRPGVLDTISILVLFTLNLILGLLRAGNLLDTTSLAGLSLVALQLVALPVLGLCTALCFARGQKQLQTCPEKQEQTFKLERQAKALRDALASRPDPRVERQRNEREEQLLAAQILRAEEELRRLPERALAHVFRPNFRLTVSWVAWQLALEAEREETLAEENNRERLSEEVEENDYERLPEEVEEGAFALQPYQYYSSNDGAGDRKYLPVVRMPDGQ